MTTPSPPVQVPHGPRSEAKHGPASVKDDSAQLAALGHVQELKRSFSFASMLGLAFAVLNSWTALAASLSLALPSGGPSAVIWGLVTAGTCNLCLAASLAEFLSAYPISAGQYYWAAAVSWPAWMPLISWITGYINASGWIALTATGGLLGSQLIMGAISFFKPSYSPQRWHQFLIYVAYTLVAFSINALLTRILPKITKAAFIWSIAGFVIISITLLSCASPDYQPADVVYGTFINTAGWPDGLAWLLGLLQGTLSLSGFDAVAHMVEEIPNPTVRGPKIIIACVGIGVFTGFIFLSVLLFVLKDLDSVVSSAAGPLLQIFLDATGSKAGSMCLLVFPLICLVFATISIMATSSRITYAFARDGALPFSRVFAKVHPGLEVPLNSLSLTTAMVVLFGCIFLGSSSAFNAIASASVVALNITYGIPPAILLARGRSALPSDRPFVLPEPWGWVCNIIGVSFSVLTTVLFVFPPVLPVDANNMNYCIVAFAVIIVISTIQWFVDGHKNYKGPFMDPGAALAIEGVSEDGNLAGQGSEPTSKRDA